MDNTGYGAQRKGYYGYNEEGSKGYENKGNGNGGNNAKRGHNGNGGNNARWGAHYDNDYTGAAALAATAAAAKGSGTGSGYDGNAYAGKGQWSNETCLSVAKHDPSEPDKYGKTWCAHYMTCKRNGDLMCLACQPYRNYVGCCNETMKNNQIRKNKGDGLCKACFKEKERIEGEFQRQNLVLHGMHGCVVAVPLNDEQRAPPGLGSDQDQGGQGHTGTGTDHDTGVVPPHSSMMALRSAPPPPALLTAAIEEHTTRLEMWGSTPMHANITCSNDDIANEGNVYTPAPPTSIDEARIRLARVMIDMKQIQEYCDANVGEV